MVVFDGHEYLTEEERRLKEDRERLKYWKKWGPYVAERQWATGNQSPAQSAAGSLMRHPMTDLVAVREDYSHDGDAWSRKLAQSSASLAASADPHLARLSTRPRPFPRLQMGRGWHRRRVRHPRPAEHWLQLLERRRVGTAITTPPPPSLSDTLAATSSRSVSLVCPTRKEIMARASRKPTFTSTIHLLVPCPRPLGPSVKTHLLTLPSIQTVGAFVPLAAPFPPTALGAHC